MRASSYISAVLPELVAFLSSRRKQAVSILCRALLLTATDAALCAAESPIVLSPPRTVILDHVQGAFDHLAFDPPSDRLFLAAEDQGTIEVIDLPSGRRVRTIAGFGNPHNIVLRRGSKTILVADSAASKSQLIDAGTYRTIRHLRLALGANCTLYDARNHRLYITTGGDRVKLSTSSLIAVNPDTGRVVQSVNLPSIHLQPLVEDGATNRLFVNLADRNMVAVVDRDTLHLLTQWPTGAAKTNSAIAFDKVNHRLFVVGEPGVMVVMNSDTGSITRTVKVPAQADDIAFDETHHWVFVPGGDGFLGIYDVSRPDRTAEIMHVATAPEARTALLIPSRHEYVVAVPARAGTPASLLVYKVAGRSGRAEQDDGH